MIKCICIDDSSKPLKIPTNKWVKQDEEYHVVFTCTVLPQKELAFQLSEIELTDAELPFEYFKASRFGFTQDNLLKLLELIKDCEGITFSMDELLKQTELQTI